MKYRQDVQHLVEQQFQEVKAVFEQAVAEQNQQILHWSEESEQREHRLERVEREVREARAIIQNDQRRVTLQD